MFLVFVYTWYILNEFSVCYMGWHLINNAKPKGKEKKRKEDGIRRSDEREGSGGWSSSGMREETTGG